MSPRTRVNGIELGPNSPARNLRTCRSESAEEQLCDDLVASIAGKEAVVKFSQAQAAQQTRGISDRRYRVKGYAFWFEVKAEDGKLTESQHQFLHRELDYGALACCGSLDDLRDLLAYVGKPGSDAATWCRLRINRWASKGFRKERAK